MPSLIQRCWVRSHVPVAVSLTLPLVAFTGYTGELAPIDAHISVRVMQPPRVTSSEDSMYRRFDPFEYRIDTVVLGLHSGLAMAVFGEAVSVETVSGKAMEVAPAHLVARRRLRRAAIVRSIFPPSFEIRGKASWTLCAKWKLV